MDNIREWALLLLFLSAGSLIYCFLLPDGNISKTAKSVLSAVLLAAVCLPFFSLAKNFEMPDFNFDGPGQFSCSPYLESSARDKINGVIQNILKNYTAVPYKTEIDIDIEQNSCIHIKCVSIIFSEKVGSTGDIEKALTDALGIKPYIRVEKGSE